MDFHGWTHPYDSKGRRRQYSELPKTIKTMEDDPYRSLAGELRTHGRLRQGFNAILGISVGRFPAPANQGQERSEPTSSAALTKALALAKSGEADYLPGWSGPHSYPQRGSGKAKGQKGKGKTAGAAPSSQATG